MTYDAVVFDMDGVIFDSERATFLLWKELADKYGLADIRTPYHACIGVTGERTREIMCAAYGPDFPFEAYEDEVRAMYRERYDGGRMPVKPGIEALLQYLKQAHKRIALASSSRKERVESLLGWAGLRTYFDVLICGDMITHSKPDPEIFLKACEALGTAPDRAYAIEDSYNGIRAAAAGGLHPIMVPDMLPPTDEMRALAETVQPDLFAVGEYLRGR